MSAEFAPKVYEWAGGPVRGEQCVYVLRDADHIVYERLRQYNLTILSAPRQTGKTSLAFKVISRLKTENHTGCLIDFRSSPGHVAEPEGWYRALYRAIARELNIEDESLQAWLRSAEDFSFTFRTVDFFQSFIRSRVSKSITIVFDELDMVQIFGYHTDEFFDAVRVLYSERQSLSVGFLLISISHPADLLKLTPPSSFNVGYHLRLPDFGLDVPTVHAWAAGLRVSEDVRATLCRRILEQTGGQPYLTSLLCHEVNQQKLLTTGEIDDFCRRFVDEVRKEKRRETHFDGPRDLILEREGIAYKVLECYRQVLAGPVSVDDLDRRVLTVLRVSGLVKESEGNIEIKCPIYQDFYNERWCRNLEADLGGSPVFRYPTLRPRTPDKRVCVINTGGTIGMERLPNGKMGQPPDLRNFFRTYSEIFKVAEIDTVSLCCEDGANIFPEHWTRLAEAIFSRRNDGYQGFVIAHGTDTLAYTACAVAFALGPQLGFPVVFTGSQTPNHILHGDARTNLLRACEVATLDIPEVVVAFGDSVFRAVRVEKRDDYRFQGFHSPTYRPLAIIAERIEVQREFLRSKPTLGWLTEMKAEFSTDILLITQHPGLNPLVYLKLLEKIDFMGIIIQSLGIGNLPTKGRYSFYPLIREAVARDVPVLITSQYPVIPEFVVNYAPASAPLQWGAIQAGNMTPAAAVTKFMWVLPQVDQAIERGDVKPKQRLLEIRRMMTTSIIGETTLPQSQIDENLAQEQRRIDRDVVSETSQ